MGGKRDGVPLRHSMGNGSQGAVWRSVDGAEMSRSGGFWLTQPNRILAEDITWGMSENEKPDQIWRVITSQGWGLFARLAE